MTKPTYVRHMIYDLIADSGRAMGTAEIATALDRPIKSVRVAVSHMVGEGNLKKEGPHNNHRFKAVSRPHIRGWVNQHTNEDEVGAALVPQVFQDVEELINDIKAKGGGVFGLMVNQLTMRAENDTTLS